jgi:hypothetical protein
MVRLGELMMILELHRQGVSIIAIARRTGRDPKTVRKYIERGVEAPVYGPRSIGRPSKLAPYLDFLRERMTAFPELSAARLTREIRELGYAGAYTAVKRYLAAIRPENGPKPYEVRFETPPGVQAQVDFARFVVDFDLEDVWALPTPGGPGDLDRLVRQFAEDGDTDARPSAPYRFLMWCRSVLGASLHLDRGEDVVGKRVVSLRERLPADLRDGPPGPAVEGTPFTSVYQTGSEWVAEFSNRTAHAVMHIGWVEGADGVHHGQMAVLVKPNGRLGRIYLGFIDPFRRVIVLPALLKSVGKKWRASAV